MKGFSLIETLVGIFLLVIVSTGIFGVFQLAMRVVGQIRAGTTAMAIATQRMEEIRNLSYQDVGTIGGIPAGHISPQETIIRNRIEHTIETTIIYIDDPFDGLAPADDIPNDYKRVEIRVFWPGFLKGEQVLVTNIVPRGKETEITGGVLAISVINAEGRGVAGANIHILNTKVSPIIDVNHLTNLEGKFVLIGAPESDEGYQITISRTNYSVDRTHGRDEVAQPLKPHASVREGDLTEIIFSIDRVSSLRVESRGPKELDYPLIPNISFDLKGAKIIGYDVDGKPVCKYLQTHTTDALAEITITNLEWDSYRFYIDKALTGFDLIGIESPPGTEIAQPIDLLPGTHQEVRLILGAENSLLVTVQDSLSQKPIFGAAVRLSNIGLGYDKIQPTNERGQTFFAPLEAVIYNLEVKAIGYHTITTTVNVDGTTTKTIKLIAL